jgi:hypothetical protein
LMGLMSTEDPIKRSFSKHLYLIYRETETLGA